MKRIGKAENMSRKGRGQSAGRQRRGKEGRKRESWQRNVLKGGTILNKRENRQNGKRKDTRSAVLTKSTL